MTRHPRDVVGGVHFFNPAEVMELGEVAHTVSTADDTAAAVQDPARTIGKHPMTWLVDLVPFGARGHGETDTPTHGFPGPDHLRTRHNAA
jgi:hypothetical protein